MKYLKLFEKFKRKNLTVDDIIKCIDNGGLIYTSIIKDFPEHSPEVPVTPLSVDDEGTTTIEIDGRNYEVELKNIDEIEW